MFSFTLLHQKKDYNITMKIKGGSLTNFGLNGDLKGKYSFSSRTIFSENIKKQQVFSTIYCVSHSSFILEEEFGKSLICQNILILLMSYI